MRDPKTNSILDEENRLFLQVKLKDTFYLSGNTTQS